MKLRWLLLGALVLPLVGCFKQKTLVVVNPDGSGNIIVSSAMSPQAAGMIGGAVQGISGAFGGDAAKEGEVAKPAADPFFDEAKLKKEAAKYGEGVSYMKGRKSNEDGWQGSVAVYSFTDISKVKIPMNDDNAMGGAMGGGDIGAETTVTTTDADGKVTTTTTKSEPVADPDAKPKQFLTFALAGGDTKTLTINVPQEDESKKKTDDAPKADAAAGGPDMTAMMLPMLKGMEMGIAVQVKGQVVKSTASNNEADGRVVIMHMDFDKMQTSPKFLELIKKSGGGDKEPPKAEMLGIPGAKFETNKVVEIEFK